MKELIQKYKDKGFKLTPQRLAILKFMEGNTSHPAAEDIYRHIKKEYPTVSFATVYNTLEALRDKGEIQACRKPYRFLWYLQGMSEKREKEELIMESIVKIGQPVPGFEMEVYNPTKGDFGKISLEDMKAKRQWLVLFFYPADFTFICPTELKDLAEHNKRLKAMGCEVGSVST